MIEMEEFDSFAEEWADKLDIVLNRELPAEVRLSALHWIDDKVGVDPTPIDDLEEVADDLFKYRIYK